MKNIRLIDAIALKETINAFYDSHFVGCVSNDLITYAKGVDGFIDNAPTITRWIPVIERLPEKKGYFLTSTAFDEVYCDFWNGEEFERTEMILAWMPLPKPYTKEEQS